MQRLKTWLVTRWNWVKGNKFATVCFIVAMVSCTYSVWAFFRERPTATTVTTTVQADTNSVVLTRPTTNNPPTVVTNDLEAALERVEAENRELYTQVSRLRQHYESGVRHATSMAEETRRHNRVRLPQEFETQNFIPDPRSEAQVITPSVRKRYEWKTARDIGSLEMYPNQVAVVRIAQGVDFTVNPDSGLNILVFPQGQANPIDFSEWARNPNRPPVERFEIFNPTDRPLLCSFHPTH